ncbi:MAG: hypothetical protein L3J35_03580 [Bacteroidales bacterium]|nr:hypothetical protein [Bacteroidales bacterium]
MSNYNHRYKDKRTSEFLVLLLESHNLLSLLFNVNIQVKEYPEDKELKKWKLEIFNELKRLNSKTQSYISEHIELSETIENSIFIPQYLKIDTGLFTGYMNSLKLRLDVLKQQRLILFEKLNVLA